jgi:hypothetical protein
MKLLLSFILLISPYLAHARIVFDITDPLIAAKTEKMVISADTVKLFWRIYNHPSHPLTPPQVLQKILEDSFLAEHARNHLSSEALALENPMGFSKQAKRHNRLITLLKSHFQEGIKKALPTNSLSQLYQFNKDIDHKTLLKLLELKRALSVNATPGQQQQAQKIIVANVTLGDKKSELTLWDIYQRQNMQGRLALHKGDIKHLKSEVERAVGSLFIEYWAENNIPKDDLAAIKQIILNEEQKVTFLKTKGLHNNMHDDNPALLARAEQVSTAQVREFYEDNKEEFSVIERAKARHLQVAEQDLADRIHDEIEAGLDFAEAIQKYSIAADRNAANPGDLGWLTRKDKNRSWLHSVAFIQQAGKVSAPFRSPQGAGPIVYEIVMVDERIDGHLEITDPTVRYEASRDIALKEMKAELKALNHKLQTETLVHVNKAALK